MDSSYVVKGVNGGASSWRDNDWIGVAGSLVAHTDLWMLVLDLVGSLGERVTVFHVHSHINLSGNDRADALANQGRLSSELYSRGLDIPRSRKRRWPDTPEVAEIDKVLSSDEELEERFIKARRLSQGLVIPPGPKDQNRTRTATPPPPHPSDFFRPPTPEPEESQDFFTDPEF